MRDAVSRADRQRRSRLATRALARLTDAVLAHRKELWTKTTDCAPIVRALGHAKAADLLRRIREHLVASAGADPRGHEVVAIPLADGLLAQLAGRLEDALVLLQRAGDTERERGRTYAAACIDIDTAAALAAAGHASAAAERRSRAVEMLRRLGCVNPI